MSAGGYRDIVTDGIIFQIDAANGLGDNVTDAKNIVNPTETGSFENGMGVTGSTYSFDGVDDYIDLGDNDNFSFGNGTADSPFSISSWIKINDTSGFRILNKYVSPIIEYQFGIGSTGNLQLYIFDSISQYRARFQSSILNTNQWYHVVSTYNGVGGVNAQDGIKIYVDGIRVDDTSVSVGDYVAMNNTTNPVYIGKLQTSYTDGNIGKINIYNKVLTQAEITQNYEATKYRFI